MLSDAASETVIDDAEGEHKRNDCEKKPKKPREKRLY